MKTLGYFVKNILGLLSISLLSFAFVSCKETGAAPEKSNVPSIVFVSVTPNEVAEYSEKVVIRIKYRDYDGDLGENNPNVKNLFVTDKRNNVTYQFRIPQLAPEGSTIPITGELPIEIDKVALIEENNTEESLVFDVYLEDRAKNKSNVISTSPIKVKKR